MRESGPMSNVTRLRTCQFSRSGMSNGSPRGPCGPAGPAAPRKRSAAALIDASFAKAPEGGEDTGPSPTDRGKSGSKHHVLTDAQGIPLNATVSAANVHEVTQALR